MVSVFVAILCLWAFIVLLLVNGITTKVAYTEIKMSDTNQFLLTDKTHLLFDTGAEMSLLADDENIGHRYWLCPALIFDTKGNLILGNIHYGEKCQIGNRLYIAGFTYTRMKKKNAHSERFPDIKGTIGMNILRKANWLFALKSQKAEAFPLDSIVPIPTDAVILSYHGCLRPLTDLNINGQRVKNVLIDTGFDQDLQLSHQTEKIELGEISKQGSAECITLITKEMVQYNISKSVKINSRSYQNVNVIFSNKNLLGLGFMRRFDYLFWDSKHKKVYLWNDESSEEISL